MDGCHSATIPILTMAAIGVLVDITVGIVMVITMEEEQVFMLVTDMDKTTQELIRMVMEIEMFTIVRIAEI